MRWAGTRQPARKNVSLEFSDARSDVIRTGVLCFQGLMSCIPNNDIIMNTDQPVISCRQKTAGPNHHLWNNHGTWWFHGTFHLADSTAERVRVNLRTGDLALARHRRESILDGRCLQTTRTLAA
jgi:hypothetical protein